MLGFRLLNFEKNKERKGGVKRLTAYNLAYHFTNIDKKI